MTTHDNLRWLLVNFICKSFFPKATVSKEILGFPFSKELCTIKDRMYQNKKLAGEFSKKFFEPKIGIAKNSTFYKSKKPNQYTYHLIIKMALNNTGSSIDAVFEKVKAAIKRRGEFGIRDLARTFKIYDDNNSRTLNKDEFKKGMRDYGLNLSQGVTSFT
jgi:hypothetical protein